MTSKVTINRLTTGVPGLDEILGGGLPEFSFNVIAGLPGCGKTTLAQQIMFALATAEFPALYLTVLGEPAVNVLRYQQQFAFFDSDAINHSIRFINLADDVLAGDLDQILARISTEVQSYGPRLVFIDSFRSLARASKSKRDMRNGLQRFMHELRTLMTASQITTFLIGEYRGGRKASPVFTVADGIIWLSQSLQRNSVARKMEIMKMRGQPSLPGLHTFRIGSGGIKVFAPAEVASAAPPEVTNASFGFRLLMGVPGLDEMLGGGLPRGYSVLVVGPSGSGKSILAAAFLAEGARGGETGVIAAFEQRPNPSRNHVLAGLIAGGSVGLVDIRSTDLSIDEIVLLLKTEIRRLKATRVVIDSLSGFELALAPIFREDFRESMLRLLSALENIGVTVLLTSEVDDRFTEFRLGPHGTAFLTDAIIAQRYLEVDSRLLRLMAVVKVRGSAHSDKLREFSIDDDGIHIGQMLSEQQGLLGGQPTTNRGSL